MSDTSSSDMQTNAGTEADLLGIPVLGTIAIFIRGLQRLVWAYGTLYLDFQVFSGGWPLPSNILQNAFWIINFLVLGFLFGERAFMNILPLATALFQARAAGQGSLPVPPAGQGTAQ